MRRVRILTSVAVGALVVAMAPLSAASAASAAPIRCGDTITTNVTLTKNLTCPADGLIVGAEGLTINLNGRSLTGAGAGVGIAGRVNSTVVNGRIRGFDVGIRGMADVRAVKFSSNRVGMLLDGGGGEIAGSTFISNDVGVIHGLGTLTVTGSTFRRNGTGMSCGDATIVVTGSRFVDNSTGISGSVCGVRIQGNRFVGGDTSVDLHSQGYFLDVRNNSFTRAGIGMSLSGVGDGTHAIVGNSFKKNRASGLVVIASDSTWGYPVQVEGNTFTGNGFNPGSAADPTGTPLTSGAWSNAGTFTHNTAKANAGHGIEAHDAVDGHGNTARSNRVEPQCLGVACTNR